MYFPTSFIIKKEKFEPSLMQKCSHIWSNSLFAKRVEILFHVIFEWPFI